MFDNKHFNESELRLVVKNFCGTPCKFLIADDNPEFFPTFHQKVLNMLENWGGEGKMADELKLQSGKEDFCRRRK